MFLIRVTEPRAVSKEHMEHEKQWGYLIKSERQSWLNCEGDILLRLYVTKFSRIDPNSSAFIDLIINGPEPYFLSFLPI